MPKSNNDDQKSLSNAALANNLQDEIAAYVNRTLDAAPSSVYSFLPHQELTEAQAKVIQLRSRLRIH